MKITCNREELLTAFSMVSDEVVWPKPGPGDGVACQECWETWTDKEFWDLVSESQVELHQTDAYRD